MWMCETKVAMLCLMLMSGVVHTGVEVHRMDSELSGLVE